MRVFVFVLFLASACVAAADPVPDSPSTTRDSTAQARATGNTPVSGIEPAWSQKPAADTDADEDQWTTRNGVNYDTGERYLSIEGFLPAE